MTSEEESWYEAVDADADLNQGEFIFSCPVVIPEYTEGSEEMDASIKEYDVVVLSQSCDIENDKIEFVLVCPVWKLKEWESKYPQFKDKNLKENLRKGYLHGHCILNKYPNQQQEIPDDFFVVDFRNIYSIQLKKLREHAKKHSPRFRLVSPYREYLSQSFARFFMRVGLPSNIPTFKEK